MNIQTELLRKAVAKAVKFSPSRATLPVLSMCRIIADKGVMDIQATNLEAGISIRIDNIQGSLDICADARLLNDVLSSIADSAVNIDFERGKLIIKTSNGETRISTVPGEEFPPMPKVEGETVQMTAGELSGLVNLTCFAASPDEARPVMMGAHIIGDGSTLRMECIDGFRVTRAELKKTVTCEAIVPANTLATSANILSGEIQMTVGNSSVRISDANNAIYITRIEGNYPQVDAIIPKSTDKKVTVMTPDLSRALKQASIFATNNLVKLTTKENALVVTAQSEETGNSETTLDAKLEGAEIQIAFNVKYLSDVINRFGMPEVTLQFNKADTPALIIVDGWTNVLMPMHVG